jgi:hypothetical protein
MEVLFLFMKRRTNVLKSRKVRTRNSKAFARCAVTITSAKTVVLLYPAILRTMKPSRGIGGLSSRMPDGAQCTLHNVGLLHTSLETARVSDPRLGLNQWENIMFTPWKRHG